MLLLGGFCSLLQAQTEENKVYKVVDQMPSFPGGASSLINYLSNQIIYPVDAKENGLEGKVVCSFIVGTDGSVTDVRVVKSVEPSLDKEAVRVVMGMPKWRPGMQNGKAVRVKYNIPVTFRLRPTDYTPTKNLQDDNTFANTDVVDDNDSIYEKVDVVPSYPEGEAQFQEIASKTIKYPQLAEDNNVDGVVHLSFVVEKDGSISNVLPRNTRITTYGNVSNSISKSCNDLFIDAVKDGLKKIQRFAPATIDGNPVRYRMMLVAVFGAGNNNVSPSSSNLCVYIRGRNSIGNLYAEDKKPYKDMHLYLLDNEYWISGINKQISALSSEDITTISKKSKEVSGDIMKKYGEKNGTDVVYDLTSYNANGSIIRPRLKTEDGLDEYMKQHLSKKNEIVNVVVSFIAETDGRISCPVVERGNDLKAVKDVIRCLRKTKGWQPAVKDGMPVRARISHFFSYKTVVTVVRRSVPVYNRLNTFDDYRKRRGF